MKKKATPEHFEIAYPKYTNSFSLFYTRPTWREAGNVPIKNLPAWKSYLPAGTGGNWKRTDSNQQGMRGWEEYTNDEGLTIVLMIRKEYCEFTNNAPPNPRA